MDASYTGRAQSLGERGDKIAGDRAGMEDDSEPRKSYGEMRIWVGAWNMGAMDPFGDLDFDNEDNAAQVRRAGCGSEACAAQQGPNLAPAHATPILAPHLRPRPASDREPALTLRAARLRPVRAGRARRRVRPCV